MSTEENVTRKLRAILSADVKGYSILMFEDEALTVKALKAYRKVMAAQIVRYKGRVVDTPGDNLLAEFASVVDAVQCAVEIQKILKERNEELPKDKRLEFRIGVNIGDVIQDGDNIYGAGVNVAARIEGLADAGGICISRNAYNHVKDKMNYGYEYLGENVVKNIKDPIRVYKVLMSPKDAGKRIGKKKKISKLKWALIAIAALLVISGGISGTLYWKFFHFPALTDIDPENKMTFELPKGPSIAVLPFDNMTGDSEQNYFCDGFTEHIISTLSYVPELFVIARNSTFAYKDKPINVQQIGVELNADWIIEGSIQKSDQRIRITVQLIDANTGHHRWSETYDREIEHIFKLQDDIAFEILESMRIELVDGRSFRNSYEGINSAEEYRKFLKAYVLLHEYTIESLKLAEQEFHKLIKMNPNIPSAYCALAAIYLQYIWQGECKSDLICFAKASEAVKSAIRVNDNFDLAYIALGDLLMMMRQYEKAENAIKTAMHINRSNSAAYNSFGLILICQGKFNEAVAQIEKAILLDPLPNWYYYLNLGQAYQGMKSYSKAIEYYNKSIKLNPKHWGTYAGLTVSYSSLEKFDKAKKAKSRLLSIRPDFTISQFLKVLPLQNKEAREIMREGFRKAGIPE